MRSIILNSYAKVNIGLQIRNERQDGYHNIHTVFQELELHDIITLTKCDDGCKINVDAENIPDDERNTCTKAYAILQKNWPGIGGVGIDLIKNIPSGGGLGGGSSNAAVILKGLNKIYNLNLSLKELEELALSIGADVPFFIKGGTQVGDGIGEILTQIDNPVQGYYLLILPDISISTAWAYQSYKKYLDEYVDRPNFAHFLEGKYPSQTIFDNDFERIVIPTYPEIGVIKDGLKQAGAEYASLSGSGSTVYGIFSEEAQAKRAELKFREQYRTFLTRPTNV